MPGFDKSILTDVGWDALTDAEAGQHIVYTHLEAGDGFVYGGDAEMFAMTALKNKIMDFPITNFSNDGQGQITLVGVLSSANVTTGFDFREIGVRCTIDGGPSILYAVSNAGEEADYIPSSGEASVVIQSVQIIIRIDRAENVTINIQPGIDLTAQNIGPASVGPGWFRDKSSQILWFKRLISPLGTIDLSETSDTVSVDVATISENLDMFVALGNPDIFPNFSTIQKALDYLIPKTIVPGIFVTITVSAGTWVGYPTTIVNHPQGSQIKIIGTASAPKNVSSVSGNASAITLGGPAGRFSDMNVGDYFYYKNMGSLSGKAISGIRAVTARAADGSSISFDPAWWGTLPNLGGVSGGTVTHIKTIHKPTGASAGTDLSAFMTIRGNGLGLLKNMVWVGPSRIPDPGPEGFSGLDVAYGTANLEMCHAYKFYCSTSLWRATGMIAYLDGVLNAFDCSATECGTGLDGGNLATYGECFGCSCEAHGVWASGGSLTIYDGAACGNQSSGFHISEASIGYFSGMNFSNNAGVGLQAILNSYASGSANLTTIRNNSVRDVNLWITSTIARVVGPTLSYGSSNVAPNTISADGCYFMP